MAQMEFPAERLRLQRIYASSVLEGYSHYPLEAPKIDQMYGGLRFPEFSAERTFTYGSFVCSVDGRIAFPKSPDGTLLAKRNSYDPDGGLADYWILTMLRAVSGAVLMGSKMIQQEPGLTARIADGELERARLSSGRPGIPLHVVVTRSGENLPLNHRIITSSRIPALIVASPHGRRRVAERLSCEFLDLGELSRDVYGTTAAAGETLSSQDILRAPLSLAGVGQGDELDAGMLLRLLKGWGVDSMLVESPTFLMTLLRARVLDELYLTTSGIFVGGSALTIGQGARAFEADDHPHTRTLSIHSHGDHFFYSRYSLIYE